MTTIKAYTDIEQSKKLAEILPIESADMCYPKDAFEYNYAKEPVCHYSGIGLAHPCWSLVALLNVLPIIDDEFEPQLHRSFDRYYCTYTDEEDSSGLWRVADNPIDACYEMILMLNELNLL